MKKGKKVLIHWPLLAQLKKKQYLCSVKQIAYISPVRWMRGNLSGRQSLGYDAGRAYDVPLDTKVPADSYQPRLIAKVLNAPFSNRRNYFQVRTRTSVNMTPKMKNNLACMGAAGAMYAALVSDKTSAIYLACVNACPRSISLRAFIVPLLRSGFAAKQQSIIISEGVEIVNPWVSQITPNVQVAQPIIDKFASELSNS